MPVLDKNIYLRSGATDLSATEDGPGVNVGKGPLHDTMFFIHAPSAGTTVTIQFQESSDDGDSDAYAAIPGIPDQVITAAGMYYVRAFWTEEWVRQKVTAITGNFGKVKIGFVHGAHP